MVVFHGKLFQFPSNRCTDSIHSSPQDTNIETSGNPKRMCKKNTSFIMVSWSPFSSLGPKAELWRCNRFRAWFLFIKTYQDWKPLSPWLDYSLESSPNKCLFFHGFPWFFPWFSHVFFIWNGRFCPWFFIPARSDQLDQLLAKRAAGLPAAALADRLAQVTVDGWVDEGPYKVRGYPHITFYRYNMI